MPKQLAELAEESAETEGNAEIKASRVRCIDCGNLVSREKIYQTKNGPVCLNVCLSLYLEMHDMPARQHAYTIAY